MCAPLLVFFAYGYWLPGLWLMRPTWCFDWILYRVSSMSNDSFGSQVSAAAAALVTGATGAEGGGGSGGRGAAALRGGEGGGGGGMAGGDPLGLEGGLGSPLAAVPPGSAMATLGGMGGTSSMLSAFGRPAAAAGGGGGMADAHTSGADGSVSGMDRGAMGSQQHPPSVTHHHPGGASTLMVGPNMSTLNAYIGRMPTLPHHRVCEAFTGSKDHDPPSGP